MVIVGVRRSGLGLVRAILASHPALSEAPAAQLVVDSNPTPAASSLGIDAHLVHVVRDGRDVAASQLEMGLADDIEDIALAWWRQVRRIRQTGHRIAERYTELRYEELVHQPTVTLRLLCEPLGLTFDPAMLDHRASATAMLRAGGRPHENRYLNRPLMRGLRDWRRDMPLAAIERFEALAGDTLAELGYDLVDPRRGRVGLGKLLRRFRS